MADLTQACSDPCAKPDGTRAYLERAEYGHLNSPYCGACRDSIRRFYPSGGVNGCEIGTRTGPFTWLQGQTYCETCYPKMVAVLEADENLAALKKRELAKCISEINLSTITGNERQVLIERAGQYRITWLSDGRTEVASLARGHTVIGNFTIEIVKVEDRP